MRHEGVPPSNNLIKDGTHRATVFVGPTLKSFHFTFVFAKLSDAFMEVTFLETKKILSTVGTLVVVGAVSMAGAALWTNVLDDKVRLAKAKRAHSNSDKVIVVDFKKTRRDASR